MSHLIHSILLMLMVLTEDGDEDEMCANRRVLQLQRLLLRLLGESYAEQLSLKNEKPRLE